MCFLISFLVGFRVFYDLSSLGNFYNVSVDNCFNSFWLVFFFGFLKYFYFYALMKIAILISALYKFY